MMGLQFEHAPGAQAGILFANSHLEMEHTLQPETPVMLYPLLGKSPLQRAVELLVRNGCTDIYLVSDNIPALQPTLQDGERWGCRISYYEQIQQEKLCDLACRLGINREAFYWLADASHIPLNLPHYFSETASTNGVSYRKYEAPHEWAHWGCFRGNWLYQQSCTLSYDAITDAMRGLTLIDTLQLTQPSIVSASLADLFLSAKNLIDHHAKDLIQVEHHTQIHPTATLLAPVYIGEGVKISANAIIGPNVIIEKNCFIDQGSHLQDAHILPETYVGKDLDLKNVMAIKNWLINLTRNSITVVTDPWLLSGMPMQPLNTSTFRHHFHWLCQTAIRPFQTLSKLF